MNSEKAVLYAYFSPDEVPQLIRDDRQMPVLKLQSRGNVPVLVFPGLESCGFVDHLYSTRGGGVSDGIFANMNFSKNLGDDPEKVTENFKRIAGALSCRYEDLTSTRQTHTTNIITVREEDRGKGISREPDYQDVDGLVTNVPGITLAVYTADCVPVYFVDPVHKAIGLAHSGWRGTAGNMAGKMVERMRQEYGTNPEELLTAIGPSICQSCYEVDDTVAGTFQTLMGDCERDLQILAERSAYPVCMNKGMRHPVEQGRVEGKYQLDLWLVNMILLLRAGVLPEKMEVTDLCTCHNPRLLFSHRASQGKRGNMGGFLKIRKNGE